MTNHIVNLAEIDFFKGLNESYINELSDITTLRSFDDRDHIIEEGEKAEDMFVVNQGQVHILTDKLNTLEDDEPQPTAIQTMSRGEVLGWSWFVSPHEWRFTAKAVGAVETIVVDGRRLREMCESNKEFGYQIAKRLLGLVTDRLSATRFQLSTHTGKPFSEFQDA